MKLLRLISRILILLSVAGFIATFALEAYMVSKAQLIQRLEPFDSATAALTGELGTPIGEPRMLIVTDAGAFLPGFGPRGERYISDPYMRSKGLYPLQAQTVEFMGDTARLVLGGLSLGSIVAFWFAGRRIRRHSHECAGGACPLPGS